METGRAPSVLKLLPSFADFAFLLPIVFLFGRMDGLMTLLGDCDTGWHIRTGEWILANRQVPVQDLFSYSKAGAPWFAWEWLSDVLFAWLNHHGGLKAVAVFGVVMLSIIILLAFQLARQKSNTLVAIAVTVIATAASSIHWLARPHLFTMMFIVLFYGALERVREGHPRLAGIPYLALLPAATILWTNLHGGFIAGVVLIGAYGMGELLRSIFTADESERPALRRESFRYFGCALACVAASLANPYFYKLHWHIAKYMLDPFNGQYIEEFLSPSFHRANALFFEAVLAGGAAAACWRLSQRRFIEPLVLLVWAHAALLGNRYIPLYALIATPVIAAAANEWLCRLPELNVARWLRIGAEKFNRLAMSTGETEAVSRWHLVSAAGVLFIALIIWAPNPPKKFRAEFDPDRFPSKALAALRLDSSARIFAYDQWGDYLIWSLYPRQKVFLDGRSDFYGTEFERKCLDVFQVKHGWEETLARFGVNTILLPPTAPLTGALKESSRWKVVYDDGIAVVFRPTQSAPGSSVSAANLAAEKAVIAGSRKPEGVIRPITPGKSKT